MCECIKELEEKIKQHATEKKLYKKPIKKVQMQGKMFSLSSDLSQLGERTVTKFEIELDGQKTKRTMPVAHSYCPFCGEKKAA